MADEEWSGVEAEAEATGKRGDTPNADGLAAALAVDAIRHRKPVSPEVANYLERQASLAAKQEKIVDLQLTGHAAEARRTRRSARLKHATDSLKLAFQVCITTAAFAVGTGLVLMVVDAVRSQSVVVDAFKAPSEFAARGLTGDVVASDVLDGLQKLKDATRGPSQGLKTKSAWSSDIKIELPETGVSIGEIQKLVKERFGHDVHIGGDLVQTSNGGLALTVRGDDVPAQTFTGGVDDVDKLAVKAAEYIYGRSQPWLYAVYLATNGRDADAIAFLPGAFGRATSDAQRADFANVWGVAYNDLNKPTQSIAKYRLAMSLSPPQSTIWWKAWGNILIEVSLADGEEQSWKESMKFLQAAQDAPSAKKPELRFSNAASGIVWDLPLALQASLQDASRNGGAGASSLPEGPSIADTYALMHDPAQAERYMVASDPDDQSTKIEADLIQAYAALDHGDGAAAIPPMEAYYKVWLADPSVQIAADSPCFLGLAYGLVGRINEAEAVFKRIGAWSRCYAFRGDVLAHAGDVAGAQRVWAEGLRIAPDMMPVYLHRGLFELSNGDLRAAQADFAIAHAKAPHYADPLKGWGDVLARAGRWSDAVVKYDEALKYAPAWSELREARHAASRRLPT